MDINGKDKGCMDSHENKRSERRLQIGPTEIWIQLNHIL